MAKRFCGGDALQALIPGRRDLVRRGSGDGAGLKALARLSRLFRDATFRQRLIDAPTGDAMYEVIREEDAKT